MADLGLGMPPIADLFAGLGASPETPDPPRSVSKDMLLAGEKGRDRYRAWRQTPPDQAERIDAVFDGAEERTRQMLASNDMDSFLAGLRRGRQDVVADQHARFWLQRYADQVEDQDAAQYDIAKFADAARRGVVDPKTASLWARLAGPDGTLDEEEGSVLLSAIRHLGDATAGLGPDLNVGKAGVVSRVSPTREGVRVVVSKRTDADEDLPIPTPGVIPASVLAESLPRGEHQVVSPGGSTVPVLKSDLVRAHRYRGWYPAVVGDDGLARWAPARAQKVSSVRSNVALEAARSGVAEVVHGEHWALDGEDSVVFTLPTKGKAPAGAVKLRRAERIAPELRRERLTADRIDPGEFVDPDNSPLHTHQWAVLPDSEAVRGRLARSGHTPIDVEGPSPAILVFGIDPEDAQAAVAPVRGGEVLVNEGRILRDGQLDPQQGLTVGADGDYVVNLGGRKVGFSVEFAPDGELVTERAPTSSRTTAVAKYRAPIPEGRDPADFAAELEAQGAADLAVYARTPAAEGWQNASDELFSDGIETLAVRTAGYRPETPNSIPVWVRSTDGLATEPVSFARVPAGGGLLDFGTFRSDGEMPLSGRFAWQDGTLAQLPDDGEADVVVRVRGGKAVVEVPADAVDITPALDARDSLTAGGFPAELRLA